MTLNRGDDRASIVEAMQRLFDLLIKNIGFEGRSFSLGLGAWRLGGLEAWGLEA